MPIVFFSSRNAFNAHEEKLPPQTETNKIIKTGIYAYSRTPIYLCFVLFHFGMFLTFENIMYFLCSIGLFFWLNNFVIYEEEKYLKDKFGDKVIIKTFEKPKGFIARKLSSSFQDPVEKLTNIIEEKSMWHRFGL